jgi:hypothetical protein
MCSFFFFVSVILMLSHLLLSMNSFDVASTRRRCLETLNFAIIINTETLLVLAFIIILTVCR